MFFCVNANMEGYTYKYPHPAVACDCVVFGFDGHDVKVLLIERKNEPCRGMWAFPGGFMNIDEAAEDAARRELQEETGMTLSHIWQLGAYSAVDRDPRERVISIVFYSLTRLTEVCGGDDAAAARWWPVSEIPSLAFDHDLILRHAVERLCQAIQFKLVDFSLLDDGFTAADLQRIFESIQTYIGQE